MSEYNVVWLKDEKNQKVIPVTYAKSVRIDDAGNDTLQDTVDAVSGHTSQISGISSQISKILADINGDDTAVDNIVPRITSLETRTQYIDTSDNSKTLYVAGEDGNIILQANNEGVKGYDFIYTKNVGTQKSLSNISNRNDEQDRELIAINAVNIVAGDGLTGGGTIGSASGSASDKTIKLQVNADRGLSIDTNKDTVGHSNSITASSVSSSGSGALTFKSKFSVPSITYDKHGHITAATTTEITMPSDDEINKNLSSLANRATSLETRTQYIDTSDNSKALYIAGETDGSIIAQFDNNGVKAYNFVLSNGNDLRNLQVVAGNGLTGGGAFSSNKVTLSLPATGTTGTYGPTANVTGDNTKTIKVPQITTDAYGRVTKVTERIYTSVDTKVKQTSSTSSSSFPLLASSASNPSSGSTYEAIYDTGVLLKPNEGVIYATGFNGDLEGTATYADQWSKAITLNGTSVQGGETTAITTAKWGASRGFNIASHDGSNPTTATNIDGSSTAGYTLKLPSTITATTFKGALTGNVTGNVSGSSGSCTGNAATATKLKAAIALKVGNTSKNFDGSAGLTWTHQEIGYANSSSGLLSATDQTIAGNKTFSNNLTVNGALASKTGFELYGATPHIDFHYNNSTDDYTSRIWESTSGILNFVTTNGIDISGGDIKLRCGGAKGNFGYGKSLIFMEDGSGIANANRLAMVQCYQSNAVSTSLQGTSNACELHLKACFPIAGSTDAAGLVIRAYDNKKSDIRTTSTSTVIYGAAWNDYAEFRKYAGNQKIPYGRVVIENGDDSLSLSTLRLQKGGNVCSDTFGFAIGENENMKMPIAVAGRALVYTYEDRNSYKPGDAVCSAPNGTVSKMTREEIKEYPDCIIGYVSAIPDYETWSENNIVVDGRIWIKVV